MANFDPAMFERQRRALMGNFGTQAALNAYKRYLAQARSQRQLTQFEEAPFATTATGGLGEVPKLTSAYARRGLQGQGIRSGIYNQALSSYARQRARQGGYLAQDMADQMRGFDLAQSGLQSQLEEGLANLEASKAAQIAADAAALYQLR